MVMRTRTRRVCRMVQVPSKAPPYWQLEEVCNDVTEQYDDGTSSSGSSSGSGTTTPTTTPLTQAQQDALQGIVRDSNGNIIHDARAIINETDRAKDISKISGASGVTKTQEVTNAVKQSQENVKAANQLLPSIELKLAGKLPLTGGETYASLLKSKIVLENAIQAENKYSGVPKSYGSNPALMTGLVAFGEQRAAQLAQVTPELAKQYASGKVQMGQTQVEVTKAYQEMYGGGEQATTKLSTIINEAKSRDIDWISKATGLPYNTIESNYGDYEGKLGKYSYSNLLKTGQKEAYQKGSAFVGGIGLTLESVASKVIEINGQETELNTNQPLITEFYLDLGEGLTSDELTAISKMELNGKQETNLSNFRAKRAGNLISITKAGGITLDTRSEPFNINIREERPKEPEIFQFNGVFYTKEGKTFATIMSEDIFSKMNALQESNRLTAIELDKANANSSFSFPLLTSPTSELPITSPFLNWALSNREQILNVPREYSIDILTGLGTKTPLELLHGAGAAKLSLELQFKQYMEGLTLEEQEVLPRIQAEARGGTFEGLTEPAKLYVFNKLVTYGIPKLGEITGNVITKAIGTKAASQLVISGTTAVERSALVGGNEYLLGQFGRQVATKLTGVALVSSGALSGVDITTDEQGGISLGFNPQRAVGGVVTMGGFVLASSVITSIGSASWEMSFGQIGKTNPKVNSRLPNPFQKSSLVNLKEGEARQLTGVNSAKDIASGKLQAKGEANALIEAQKQAMSDYNYYRRASTNAPLSQRYGLEYKADAAKRDIMRLQIEIAKYVKQPTSTTTISGIAKQKVGLFQEYKWGTQTITTTTKPDAMGRMTASSTITTFTPENGGTRTLQFGRIVLGYDTNKFLGFEYPTGKPFVFRTFSTPNTQIKIGSIPDMPTAKPSGTTITSSIPVGSGEATSQVARITSKVNVAVMPKFATITKTQAKVIVTPRIETKTVTKEKVVPKIIAKTEVKIKPLAKYAINYGITERVATKTNVAEKINTKIGTKEIVKERISERIATKSIIRERIATKVLLKTRLNIKVPERPKFLPPSQRFNMKSKGLGKLSLKSGGKKKNEPYAYSDLFNVAQSQLLFGKGTSPNKARPQTQQAIKNYGYRLQTAEQIKSGRRQAKTFKLGKSKWNGGLSL